MREKAAAYLKRSVARVEDRPYLPHMPEFNRILQAHSTVAAALDEFQPRHGYEHALRHIVDWALMTR
jgi:hypothetical protein